MSQAVSPGAGPEEVGTSPADAESCDLTLDVIYEALKNERRRRVLAHLRASDGTVELGDLAERIAAEENDKTVAEISYEERKRVYVALYQTHLPKMDEMGIVSFEQSRGVISLTERATRLYPYLEMRHERRDWYRYYGVAVLGGLAVLAGLVATGIPASVSANLALGTVLVGVGSCAAFHTWTARNRSGA